MPGCCAPNCSNSMKSGVRFFSFPRDKERRKRWAINCRRDKWQPTDSTRICEIHFEESQWETKRLDGKKFLLWNAIPTIFDVPNAPKLLTETRKRRAEPVLPVNYVGHDHVYAKKLHLDETDHSVHSAIANPVDHLYSKKVTVDREQPMQDIGDDAEVIEVTDNNTDEQTLVTENDPVQEVASSSELNVKSASSDLIAKLKKRIKQLEQQVRLQRESYVQLTSSLQQFLNEDQIRWLKLPVKSKRTVRWSNRTIKSCLQQRYLMGAKGYSHLTRLGYPVPSYRTLCERVENASFHPGIQHDVLEWLRVKMAAQPDSKIQDCSLALDEMQLRPCIEYDKGLKIYTGYVTPPFENAGPATHALVFILHGLTVPWKQTVAYYLTGNSTPGKLLWEVTRDVIRAAQNIGLTVRVCVSDMGPSNRDMWKSVGVYSTREGVVDCIDHPCIDGEKLYFMADTPHLLKNIRNCMLTQDILIPDKLCQEQLLPTNRVTLDHVRTLVNLQENSELKLAPKLNKTHVDPGQYQKMRVNMAAAVISHTTASALRFCVAKQLIPQDALTTAWFLDLMNEWYDAMNARCIPASLFASSTQKLQLLQSVLDTTRSLEFTGRSCWKPIQAGIQLSTTVVCDLYDRLVTKGSYRFLMTGRLTQDCVENLFSSIRGRGDSHPSPVLFRHNLRLISLSQFMNITSKSSYDTDNSTYFLDFLKQKRPVLPADEELGFIERASTVQDLNVCEQNVLFLLAGWSVFKEKNKIANCSECLNALTDESGAHCDVAEFLHIKSYGGLTCPSKSVLTAVQDAETVFREFQNDIASRSGVEKFLCTQFQKCHSYDCFPQCHNAIDSIVARYFRLRIHIHGKWLTSNVKAPVQHGSRTAYRRSIVK